ncbi:MAG: suppressor of fused domain protein [Polyangiaceae bacterium]|nr:suppressor of fused domain protein [Polyangiaceae bacterium]
MTKDITQHLERHLGEIARGWKGSRHIGVAEFPNQPQPGVMTYTTLGLSVNPLPMARERTVRQELVVSAYQSFDPDNVASFLVTFAEYICAQSRALLRGDVVGPADPLIPGVRASAVYASIPVFFDDDFSVYQDSSPPTVLVWLIPLPREDAEFVKTQGWEPFEDMLESTAVDFWDLNRPPLAR